MTGLFKFEAKVSYLLHIAVERKTLGLLGPGPLTPNQDCDGKDHAVAFLLAYDGSLRYQHCMHVRQEVFDKKYRILTELVKHVRMDFRGVRVFGGRHGRGKVLLQGRSITRFKAKPIYKNSSKTK